MSMFEKLKAKIRGTIDLDRLKKDGLIVGNNFHAMDGVIIDPGHCWLIEIGDNVTLAPRVHVLAHDASTKNAIGYTKISNVVIGNNVFVGAGSIILPGVKIDSNTVIGCGSVVSKDLSSGIWVGNPCVKISEYDDWREKHKQRTSESIVYDESYTIGNITDKKKEKMKKELKNKTGGGYII